ncbi:MAG: SH3 domain-containing protein [Bacteroidota bacterium]
MYKQVRLGFLLLLFSLPLLLVAGQNAEIEFKKANQLYAKLNYKDAASIYQQMLKTGHLSADIYYNLGNSYYKLGEIPEAILNYEKAYKLAPGDADIQANLRLANLRITDKIEAVPEFFISKWWHSFILFTSAEVLAVFSVIGFLLGFGLLIVYLFAVRIAIKRPAFYAGTGVLSLALLLTIVAVIQHRHLNALNSGIVFSGTVNVKSGPNASFKSLYVIHEGIKVAVVEQNDGWLKVVLPNGNIGWIRASDIQYI